MAGQEAALDLGQLSEPQQLALQQFTSVTDQELSAAIPLLERSQWNVQIAIAKFFDGESADPVAEARASLDSIPPPSRTSHRETLLAGFDRSPHSSPASARFEPAPRVVPQPPSDVSRSPSLLLAFLLAPVGLIYRLLSSSLGIFAYLFPFLSRFLPARTAAGRGLAGSTAGRRPLSARDGAARFIREFEEEYGSNDWPFLEHGYAQALDLAKKDLKFLLVLLVSPEHDDTASFIRETLLAPELVQYVNESRDKLLVWAGTVQDSEAYQVSSALNCTKFPFAALIMHTPAGSSASMSVVARIVGPVSLATFVAELQTAVARHSDSLDGLRAARAARQSEQNLRNEQNSAYERSLAQDRERARRRREAEAARVEAERLARERAEAQQLSARRLRQWKLWRLSSLPAEPSSESAEVCRISVRMVSGDRVVRKFAANTEIETLYAFVECYDLLNERDESEAVEAPPSTFEHEYPFQLVSPIPRIVYGVAEGGTLGSRIGRSGNLIVEPLTYEEDEDDADGGAVE